MDLRISCIWRPLWSTRTFHPLNFNEYLLNNMNIYYPWNSYLSKGKKVIQWLLLTKYLLCAGLEEAQAGIKIAGRNINNLRYADDTTLMAESEEELKSLLTKLKEEIEKVVLKLNIQKTKIIASGLITSWQIDFIFMGSKITMDGDCIHEIKRCLLLGRKVMTNLDRALKSNDIYW